MNQLVADRSLPPRSKTEDPMRQQASRKRSRNKTVRYRSARSRLGRNHMRGKRNTN